MVSSEPIEDLVRSLGLLIRKVRAAGGTTEISMTQSNVMSRLATQGPTTVAELARSEGIKPQSMGTAIAALSEMGFVERRPHPTDGRQMNVELTTEGALFRQNARENKREWLRQSIEQLDEGERSTLLAAAKVIKRLAEI